MAERKPDPDESSEYKMGWGACRRDRRRDASRSADWLRGWDDCHAGRFGDLDPMEFADFEEGA